MRRLQYLFILFCLFVSGLSFAQTKLPNEAEKLLPILKQEINRNWNTIPIRQMPAGLIEQESLWKSKAVLKTDREYGCGLGQFTKTYKADGSIRFDTLSDMKRLDSTLSNWTWEDCFNVQLQMRAVILKLKVDNRSCVTTMANTNEAMACTAAKYNGGAGSIVNRVRTCRLTPGCDPTIWFNNLQTQCPMSNVKQKGYGESFCQINSKYPGRVFTRMEKYKKIMND